LNRQPTISSSLLLRVSLCSAALVGLAGCPQGAELEDPDKYGPINNTGGTAPTAGSGGSGGGQAGGAPVCPTGGTAETIPNVTCDWATAVTKSCAISSCHGRLFQYGGLLLTPDSGFTCRVKDKVVTLADVDCDPDPVDYLACTEPPTECQPFVGHKVVDSANPDASFMLTKMLPGCGNIMPLAPGDSEEVGWNEERRACIESLVRAIAAMP
jgi:hypothetical protein